MILVVKVYVLTCSCMLCRIILYFDMVSHSGGRFAVWGSLNPDDENFNFLYFLTPIS